MPGVGSLRWACTFHALGDANLTRRQPFFWWNMGLKIEHGGLGVKRYALFKKELYSLANMNSVYSISIKRQVTQLFIDILDFRMAELRAV